MSSRLPFALLLLLLAIATPRGALPAQAPEGAAVTVKLDDVLVRVVGAGGLQALPRVTVTASGHGRTHRYTGVALAALLAHAGAWPVGDAGTGTAGARGNLRGAALARYVVVTAADGYRAVLALAELDTATVASRDGVVILADAMDGRPLPVEDGPFRLVVPSDRRPARSVRQVRRIEVRAAP